MFSIDTQWLLPTETMMLRTEHSGLAGTFEVDETPGGLYCSGTILGGLRRLVGDRKALSPALAIIDSDRRPDGTLEVRTAQPPRGQPGPPPSLGTAHRRQHLAASRRLTPDPTSKPLRTKASPTQQTHTYQGIPGTPQTHTYQRFPDRKPYSKVSRPNKRSA